VIPNAAICLSVVWVLWALWFVVLCLERRWFRDAGRSWKDMPPSTKAVMAVLCAYCTVTAQKPQNVNSNAPPALPDMGTATGGAVLQQQPSMLPLPATSEALPDAPSEPSRSCFRPHSPPIPE